MLFYCYKNNLSVRYSGGRIGYFSIFLCEDHIRGIPKLLIIDRLFNFKSNRKYFEHITLNLIRMFFTAYSLYRIYKYTCFK